MKSNDFYLSSSDWGDLLPRKCWLVDLYTLDDLSQLVYEVNISPPLKGSLVGSHLKIDQILLGMIDSSWSLNRIGEWGFMVDIYAKNLNSSSCQPESGRCLKKIGVGLIWRAL